MSQTKRIQWTTSEDSFISEKDWEIFTIQLAGAESGKAKTTFLLFYNFTFYIEIKIRICPVSFSPASASRFLISGEVRLLFHTEFKTMHWNEILLFYSIKFYQIKANWMMTVWLSTLSKCRTNCINCGYLCHHQSNKTPFTPLMSDGCKTTFANLMALKVMCCTPW